MSYNGLLERLNRRGMFRIRPSLEYIREVLGYLGNPQDRTAAIHIAGTNGKGSVAASLESVLRRAGLRTGLYTSPHLRDVRERIRINKSPIGVAQFWETAQRVYKTERRAGVSLTYFEFLTAMAFLAFAAEGVEVAVIETGMGGRWDATNVLKNPVLTVITSIGLDHTKWLGRTEQAIAREKAGILKNGCPIVSGARGSPAGVIAAAARAEKAPLWQIDKDFHAMQGPVKWLEGRQSIDYWGPQGHQRVMFGLLGAHQIDNAALILAALNVLTQTGWKLPYRIIEQGMDEIDWPGRFQVEHIPGKPCIILDGAHNLPAMRRLCETLDQSPWQSSVKTFVFGVYHDKDYRHMIQAIASKAFRVIFCSLPGSRALSAKKALASWKGRPPAGGLAAISDPHKAFQQASRSTPKNGLVVATGSLALIGILLGDLVSQSRSTCRDAEMDGRLAVSSPGGTFG